MNELRRPSKRCRLSRLLAILRRDESGNVLLYFTIMLPVIFGLIGLVLAGGSFFTLNNQLQALADGAALAGAKELDRNPKAMSRAWCAAQNALSNDPRWSWSIADFVGSQIQTVEFFGPNIDDGPLDYAAPNDCSGTLNNNDNDHLAGFIKVTTVTRETIPTFIAAAAATVGAGPVGNARTAATATASYDLVVCDSPPMYICNPFETAGMTYNQATQALQDAVATARGKMISMRRDPGNSNLLPGNYGFLNASGTNGFNAVRDAIARIHSPACFKKSSVDFQTGFAGNSIAPAVNVRFDAYGQSMSQNKNDPNYAPAKDVRKGYWLDNGNNWCSANPCLGSSTCNPDNSSTYSGDEKAFGLPGDNTSNVQGPLGAGDWDFESYWNHNHPNLANQFPNGWSNTNRPSRYDVYQYEISQGSNPGGLQDASAPGLTPGPQEIGAPRCNTNVPPANVDRRLMVGAVINCLALGPLNGSETNVPVAGFGKFFLIKPVQGSQDEIDSEIVDLATPGDGSNGIVHRMVQLHR